MGQAAMIRWDNSPSSETVKITLKKWGTGREGRVIEWREHWTRC